MSSVLEWGYATDISCIYFSLFLSRWAPNQVFRVTLSFHSSLNIRTILLVKVLAFQKREMAHTVFQFLRLINVACILFFGPSKFKTLKSVR